MLWAIALSHLWWPGPMRVCFAAEATTNASVATNDSHALAKIELAPPILKNQTSLQKGLPAEPAVGIQTIDPSEPRPRIQRVATLQFIQPQMQEIRLTVRPHP